MQIRSEKVLKAEAEQGQLTKRDSCQIASAHRKASAGLAGELDALHSRSLTGTPGIDILAVGFELGRFRKGRRTRYFTFGVLRFMGFFQSETDEGEKRMLLWFEIPVKGIEYGQQVDRAAYAPGQNAVESKCNQAPGFCSSRSSG